MEFGMILARAIAFYVWFSLSLKLFVSLYDDFESYEQVNGIWNILKCIIKPLFKGLATAILALFMVYTFILSHGFDINYVGIENILSSNVSIYSEVF